MSIITIPASAPSGSRSPLAEVPTIQSEAYFEPNLAKKIADFNTAASNLRAGQAAYEERASDRQNAAGADLAEIDFDNLELGDLRMQLAHLLQEELKLRRAWLDLDLDVRTAMRTQRDALEQRLADTTAKLTKGLERLGYLPFPENGTPVAGCWIPDFINRHPGIRELDSEIKSLFFASQDLSARQNQESRIDQLEKELARRRDRLMGQTA